MSLSDEIRKYVFIKYIQPAQEKGEKQVKVRAGDVHREMGLRSRIPAVCAALGTDKFQNNCNVRLMKREGPSNAANLFFTFELESISKPLVYVRDRTNYKNFIVTLERDEDGYIVVSCPALPGCHSQGRTRKEAIANITEAIRGYIASMSKHGEPIPVTDVEEVEVAV